MIGMDQFFEEIPEILSKFQKRLMEEGFSEAQAFSLVSSYFSIVTQAAMLHSTCGGPHDEDEGEDDDDEDEDDDDDYLPMFGDIDEDE